MGTRHHMFRRIGVRPVVTTLTTNQQNYIWNGGGLAGDFVLIIEAGVTLGGNPVSSGSATAALRTSNFGTPATLLIINRGNIYGAGGWGGDGNSKYWYNYNPPTYYGGFASGQGGDAISTSHDISIDNIGYIFSGGKGGEGGNNWNMDDFYDAGGGGSGGGQGYGTSYKGNSGGGTYDGTDGGTGNVNGPGAAGAGYPGGGLVPPSYAGAVGGTWGSGTSYAVRKNGHVVTWISGNNGTQVKGAVA